jgi:hypothetical protein
MSRITALVIGLAAGVAAAIVAGARDDLRRGHVNTHPEGNVDA